MNKNEYHLFEKGVVRSVLQGQLLFEEVFSIFLAEDVQLVTDKIMLYLVT